MPNQAIAGLGRKRPQLDKKIIRLYLDGENPRLPEDAQGKGQIELLKTLYEKFYLDELAESMAQNGYFDEEPLVAIPQVLPAGLKSTTKKYIQFIEKDSTPFIVVEGNRRLATAKMLIDTELRDRLRIKHWPEINEQVADDLRILPVIIYPHRREVIPYLGVRHIVGIQKWDSYAKARYVAKMVEGGQTIKEVEAQIGDKQGSVTKNYVSYKLLEQAKNEFEINTRQAESDFSLLLLSIGQGNIKRFLGLPQRWAEVNLHEPVPQSNVDNLRKFISFIYGDERNKPVIRESRDITNYLSHVVVSPEALAYLERTRNLLEAYDRSDGEETMLLKYLSAANSKLETSLGIAHRHKTFEVISEVEKCAKTVSQLLKTVRENND